MQIVTGRRGEPHVTSRQMQAVYRSFLGDFALLDIGEKLRAEAYSNDIVRVYDGVVSVQGIYAVIAYNQYDEVYIEPVSVGKKRIDTIVLHYTKDNTLDVEDLQLDVVQGDEYTDNPIAPVVPEGGDAWEGTTDIQVPIYDVEVTNFGLTVTPYARMLNLIPTLESIAERIPETFVTGVKGDSEVSYRDGNVNITKANIGLGNVDNTADTDKPISTATQTALNLKADLAYVDAKISAAYHAGGSKTVAELTSALLIADNMGKVYNMSDSGVTTSDFVEGAGEPINEGDNVGICNVGTEETPVYKFDLLSGFVDLSNYVTTTAMNTALDDKVDKVEGKGLSTEDYTSADKTKLAGIEAEANKTVVDSAMSDSSTNPLQNKVITKELEGAKTTTGNPLTITDAAPVNAVNVSMDLEPIQAGSGTPSPDNIRPISGRSEVEIDRVGKNQWDNSDTENGYIDSDGIISPYTGYASLNYTKIKSGETYVLSFNRSNAVSNDGMRIAWYTADKQFIQRDGTSEGRTAGFKSFEATAPANAVYARASINTTNATNIKFYQTKTYTIQFGQTVYGGQLDATKGELVVDRASVDLGDLNWTYATDNVPRFGASFPQNANYKSAAVALNGVSSAYSIVPFDTLYNPSTSVNGTMAAFSATRMTVRNDSYTDAIAFKTAMSGVQLVYELATPITIPLTPQQIKLLENTNTVYTDYDGDTITIEYQPNNAIGEAVRVVEESYDAIIQNLIDRITALENS